MSDDDSSSDDEEEKGQMGYPMMMSYGYAYPSAYQYAAYAQAMAGYGYPGYSGYGDYASYMQQMSGQGGIATDPMSAYYGTSNYDYSDPSRQFGIIKTYLVEKAFGFIESAIQTEGDVFFSKTELAPDLQQVVSESDLRGKPVQFEITTGKDGRSRAANVQLCSLELVEHARANAPKLRGTRSSGTIKSYSERHGYGYLDLENGGEAQFRGSDLSAELLALGPSLSGRIVSCRIHELADGKYKATEMAPIPGQVGKGKGGGKGSSMALPRVRGKVTSFDPDSRTGTLSCPEKGEVHFLDLKNLLLTEGMEVSFLLKVLADNSAQGMDVSLADRDPDAPLEPFALRDGTTITATVKSFNEQRGFGFLKIPGASMDLYFHGRDMDDASQGLLMLVGGPGLSNCHATCRVEARADGRWNGRNVSLLESGTQMWDGMKMAGMISYFYDHKGFGFINVTGNPIDIYFHGRDVGPDAQQRCEQVGPIGTCVWFTVYAQTDSRWQAKDIVLSGDGSSPGGLAPEMLGGWGKGDEYGEYGWDWSEYGGGKGRGKGALPKVEKQIIQGCDLRGRLKSYNAEKNFGFISVDGQANDVYFQVWDLVDPVKAQVESLGPDAAGLTAGAMVHFWLQLMPGGGRLRARDMSISSSLDVSPPAVVEAAMQKAALVAHEAIIPGTGSILYDRAEVSGIVKSFNKEGNTGFLNVDGDETDIHFSVNDMHPDDQDKVADGCDIVSQRVWFWLEMLDNGTRWRCHEISLTYRRGAEPPPAKRQRTDAGEKVNGADAK